jgi:preprotein translocase subunit YajC
MVSRHTKLALLASMALPSTLALTEVVTLKNGSVLKGSIVQMTENDITIETSDMGQVVVKRRAVQTLNDGITVNPVEPVRDSPGTSPASVTPQGVIVTNNNNNNNH